MTLWTNRPRTVDDFRDVRGAARALAGPPAPPRLIARVIEERARGMRAAIPDGDSASARPPARRGVLAAAAAVLIIGLVTVYHWPTTQEPVADEAARGACAMHPETRALLMTGSFLLATACAQGSPSVPYEPAPPVNALGPRELQEGTWVYRVGRQGGTTHLSTYSLERVGSGPQAEWRSVTSRNTTNARGFADTVYYAADGLMPLRQALHISREGRDRWVVRSTFGRDRVNTVSDYLGYRDAPPQRRTSSVQLPGDGGPMVLAVHDPALGVFLRRLPLAAGWVGSFRVGPLGDGSFREKSLRVEAEETVEVPAGVFDCWRLTMSDPISGDQQLWVTQTGQLLVRSVLGTGGRGLESVLVSFNSAGE